ncbi:MAG: hypothetical protein LBI74_09515, partial [Synergistaceae bacterium]|nr:hypothetical protein [Synergistaceae bacterium]
MAETPFQVTGVASGIGWDEIISKTLEIARKPETIWQNKIDTLEYKKSLYEELTSQFRKLQNTLLQLNIESTYKAKTAEFIVRPKTNGGATAPDIAKATVNANADIASWDIDIDQLATAQRYISARQISTGAALGISGAFRIHVDTQVASITVEATDTLADINKKIQMSTDQKGQPLMATAKIFDNRLVIESSLTGLDKTGTLGAVNLTMSNKLYVEIQDPRDPTDPTKTIKNYITYVPKDVNNVLNPYPSQLLSVSSDGRNYEEGIDYSYDPSNGAITWNTLDSSNNEFVTHPADGETIGVYTVYAEAFTRGAGTEDTVQPLPSGTWLGIDLPPQTPPPPLPSSDCLFTVIDENGKKYTGTYAEDAILAAFNTATPADDDFAIY